MSGLVAWATFAAVVLSTEVNVDAVSLLLAASASCILFMAFGVAQLGKAYESRAVEVGEPLEALATDPVQAMDAL